MRLRPLHPSPFARAGRARPLSGALAAVALAALAACEGGSTTAPQQAAAPSAATAARGEATSPGQVPGQYDDVLAVAAALDRAWATKDPDAFAASFAVDARFVAPIAQVQVGRTAVRAQHAFLFGGPFRTSRRTSRVDDIVFLTGTIAVMDLTVDLVDYTGRPPGLRETRPNLVQTVERSVLEKRRGTWQIVRMQHTAVPPEQPVR
jgi:uncharacterized protein (TIGR02246 family)